MTTTADIGLPLLSSQQEQPEVTHNEALIMMSAMINGVISIGLNTPPGSSTPGDAYVVGTSPNDDWAGRGNAVTVDTGSGWRFIPDRDSSGTIITMGSRQEGMRINNRSDGITYRWSGSAWDVDSFLPTSGGVGSVLALAGEPVEVFEDSSNVLAVDYDNGQWQYWTATQAGTVLSVVGANLPAGGQILLEIYDGDVYEPDDSVFTPVMNNETIEFGSSDAAVWIMITKRGDGAIVYSLVGKFSS
jgi:hypothetical protein